MKNLKFSIGLVVIILCSFVSSRRIHLKIPKNWPQPKYNFESNPLSEEKIYLGRVLFYDPILSSDSSISCGSCHSQYNSFAHADHALSHGIKDQIGIRNAPTLQNLAWNDFFMWDGAIHHLDVQALAPITNTKEMNEKLEHVILKLQRSKLYKKLFRKAYKSEVITSEKTLKAISQFMLTLTSANSKYDRFRNGKEKFSEQELRGYELFKNNCGTCHTEPLFTNGKFESNGLSIDTMLKDFGRVLITKNPQDSLKFKVPTLRNIEFSFPYMHDGRFKKLSEVLNHYQNKKLAKNSVGERVLLSSNEKVDLIAFLLTLSDKEFLFNPKHSFPREILNRSEGK